MRFGHAVDRIDERIPGIVLPLMSVSQSRGVIRRSELTDKPHRADSLDVYKVCRRDDIVFNKMSIRSGAMGVAGEDGLVTYHYEVMRPRDWVDSRFIAYLMKSNWFTGELIKRERGIGAGGKGNVRTTEVPFSVLKTIDSYIPETDEQRAIADYLDQETTQIDVLVATQEELIRLLRERQAAIADAEFQRTEGKRTMTVRQTLVPLARRSVPGTGVVTAYRDGVVTLRTNRRADGYTMSAAEAGYQGVIPGDIVFHALDGFAGAVGIADSEGQCSPVYHVCSPRYDDDAEYLSLLIRYMGTSGFLSSQAPSTRQRSVDFRNWGTFARVPLVLPTVEHQKSFVEEYRQQTTQIDTLIAKAEEHIALAKERRSALITAAVTGQFDVRAAKKGARV